MQVVSYLAGGKILRGQTVEEKQRYGNSKKLRSLENIYPVLKSSISEKILYLSVNKTKFDFSTTLSGLIGSSRKMALVSG